MSVNQTGGEHYTPRQTGSLCGNCGQELFEYWQKDSRYSAGGFWRKRCYNCRYRKDLEQDPNFLKKQYARRIELHPYWDVEWKYHITGAEYEDLLKLQSGVCAICLREETRKQNGKLVRLSVDHDHKTGIVRGLLCSRHNLMLSEEITQNLDTIEGYVKRSKHREKESRTHKHHDKTNTHNTGAD